MVKRNGNHLNGKDEVLEVLQKELPYLREEFNVRRLALFGSYVRGDQRRGSDIDILVEFKEPVGFVKFMNLEFYLRRRLGIKVDLVTPDALKPLIKRRVMREAKYAK